MDESVELLTPTKVEPKRLRTEEHENKELSDEEEQPATSSAGLLYFVFNQQCSYLQAAVAIDRWKTMRQMTLTILLWQCNCRKKKAAQTSSGLCLQTLLTTLFPHRRLLEYFSARVSDHTDTPPMRLSASAVGERVEQVDLDEALARQLQVIVAHEVFES